MAEKPLVSAFQNFFQIENLLTIKEIMSKNVSDNNNAAMLLMSHVRDVGDVKYLNKRSKATLTQQCYSCQRHRRCEISQCYVIAVCNSNHLWHLRHLLLSNVTHVRDVRDMQIGNTIQSKVSNVTHVGDVKYLNTVIT